MGGDIRCPSSFKLKGLSPGKHKLEMIPEAQSKGHGGSSSEFWVAAEDFWVGGKFSPLTLNPGMASHGDEGDGDTMFWTIIPGDSHSCTVLSSQLLFRLHSRDACSFEKKPVYCLAEMCAAYNAERWMGSAVASVRAQTHKRWRCIVIDDASSDGTESAAIKAANGDKRWDSVSCLRRMALLVGSVCHLFVATSNEPPPFTFCETPFS